jgi:anti-sigma factor RsiW
MTDAPSMLRCREIVDLLADYLAGELPPETATALETHLEGCPPCIAFVNTYRGTVNAARRIRDVEIPPQLHDRLLSFLKNRQG